MNEVVQFPKRVSDDSPSSCDDIWQCLSDSSDLLLICKHPLMEVIEHLVAEHFPYPATAQHPADDFQTYAVGRFLDAVRQRLAANSQSTTPAETPIQIGPSDHPNQAYAWLEEHS